MVQTLLPPQTLTFHEENELRASLRTYATTPYLFSLGSTQRPWHPYLLRCSPSPSTPDFTPIGRIHPTNTIAPVLQESVVAFREKYIALGVVRRSTNIQCETELLVQRIKQPSRRFPNNSLA
jgi:hypothetical protein